jgi:hypothetical protein
VIPFENLKDFPVALHCGISDHLSQIENFRWLKERLEEQKSLAFYKEYEIGHLSFMLPTEASLFIDIASIIKGFNPAFVPAEGEIPRSLTAEV